VREGGCAEAFENTNKKTVNNYLNMKRSEMTCGTQTQYPVKALADLKK
jgi:hypothetical protein